MQVLGVVVLGQQPVVDADDAHAGTLGNAGRAGEHGARRAVNKSPAVGPHQYWSGIREALRTLDQDRDRAIAAWHHAILELQRVGNLGCQFSPQACCEVVLLRPLLRERLFLLGLTLQDFG